MQSPSRLRFTFILIAALPGAAPAFAQTFTFERTIPVTAEMRLDVSTERGKIDVAAGDPQRIVVVGRVTVRAGWNVPANALALAQAAAAQPSIQEDGNVVRLRPPSDSATRQAVTVAYDVRVPTTTPVIAASDSGAISVDGIHGAVAVHTQSGAIALANLGADVQVDTGSGAVSIENVQGALRASTESGSIAAKHLNGGLHARTGSGRIEASFTGGGDVDIETGSSGIILSGVNGGLVVVTRSGEVSANGIPRAVWRISSGSSAIKVMFDPAAAITLDASTKSGSIEIEPTLLVLGRNEKRRVNGTILGGGVPVQLTSRSGSIRVGLKPGTTGAAQHHVSD